MMQRKGYWVYIPTLDRVDCLKFTVPQWMARGFNVAVVCEPHEDAKIDRALWNIDLPEVFRQQRLEICPLPYDGKGVGYARQHALQHAAMRGLDAAIFADDDVYPSPKPKRGRYFDNGIDPGGRFVELLNVVRGVGTGRPTLACSASFSYQDLATKGKIGDPWCDMLVNLHNGNCYALNTDIALSCGGFDEELGMWEDAEFMRQGIANGYPWYLHPGVHYKRLNQSCAVGGIDTWLNNKVFESRDVAERFYRAKCYDRWPKYVSPPDKRHGMKWQKMYEDYGVMYVKPNA